MKKAILFVAVCVALGMATASAQDEILVPNRLADAKVGEWASYTLPSGYIQKLTVTKRFGEGPEALVSVLIENIYEGEVVTAQEITHEAGEPDSPPQVPSESGVTVAIRQDTSSVKGKTTPATIVQIDRYSGDEDDSKVEYWITRDIPVFGIIKKVENDEVQWEIADWGEE